MLPFRPPPMNGAPVAPSVPGAIHPPGMGPPGMVPGMMTMRGPPPRGPPPMGFPPGRGLPPTGMMPRGPMALPQGPPGITTADKPPPVSSLDELGSVVVFVGKLPTDLSDVYVRSLLEKCGHVIAWKRAVDPVTSKPKGFGYCTFATAVDALRALRLLSGFSVDSTQILLKADTKLQDQFDAYSASMSDDQKQQELTQDDALRSELKTLEDERSRLQTKPESTLERKTSAAQPNESEFEDSADNGTGEMEVQQEMIVKAIGKFRLGQDQREQEPKPKRRDATRDRVHQEHNEEEKLKAIQKLKSQSDAEDKTVKSVEDAETKGVVSITEKGPAEVTDQKETLVLEESLAPVNEKVQEDASISNIHNREGGRTREREKREKRDRDREHRKRARSHSRSRSRDRSSRRRRRSRSYSRSRSRSRDRDRGRDRGRGESRRERKHDREHRRRRRNSSIAEEEPNGERRVKRRRDSRSDDKKQSSAEDSPAIVPKPPVKVVMDLKLSLGAPKKEKPIPGPAPALFQVEDEVEVKPVRALVKIDFAEEERAAAALAQQKAAETAAKINARGDDVKALIDSIPTDKTELFAYPIQWAAVNKHHVVKEKMAPWVTKKVVEYLGEEDATLISFILTKLAAKAKPDQVLDELQAILEDEAEVFVKSLWRKLAFEALRAAA